MALAEETAPPLEAAPTIEDRLGELLVERGKLDLQGLARARRAALASAEGLHLLLPKLGLVAERDVADGLASLLGLQLAREEHYPDEPLFGDRISINFLKQARLVPLADRDEGLWVAMADPLDDTTLNAMRLFASKPIHILVGVPAEIEAALERSHGKPQGLGEIVQEAGDGADLDDDVERLRDLASEAPVVRLVNRMIAQAVEQRASDIHIEPFEQALRVRYRIDGVLVETEPPPARFRAAIVSRVKIMARLDIAERRLPQDGRIKLAVRGKDIDLRVATIPTMHGEAVVLRVLDRGSVQLDFDTLGFDEHSLAAYRSALLRPNGIILVTGPTGSGKTTTLYTSLLELNTPDKKILTVEDPVEYQLDGVNQVPVRPQIGLKFANVLRSMLRHDPDIIMVGEIRDLETAQIAIQAALTGHLVLSTLHTNNAASTLTRLLDMGVEDYLLTSTLNAVVAQRLVRKLCPACREPYAPLPGMIEEFGLEDLQAPRFYHPRGCDKCKQTGFFGRIGINEVLVLNDRLRAEILKRADSSTLQRAALESGMRPMFQDGILKVLAGVTTLEEVIRVTREVD